MNENYEIFVKNNISLQIVYVEELKLNIGEILSDYEMELEELIEKTTQGLVNAPKGSLRIIHNKGSVQYYHICNGATYISKKNMDLVKSLAQAEYNKKMLSRLKKQILWTVKFLAKCKKNDLNAPFCSAAKARQNLIEPLILNSQDYELIWRQQEYEGKGFETENGEYYTSTGLRVRSKSEIIIAETLNRLKVPFRYEFPLKMKEGFIFHPDFYCLNTHTRQEFVWEHFGLMEDHDYLERAIGKINIYAKNGWISGKNFINTMETREFPLSSKVIERIVKECLLA